MFRSMLSLLLACMLVLCSTAALAEEPLLPILALYADHEPVGTGVLFPDHQTLLSVSSAIEHADTALDTAGHEFTLSDALSDGVIGMAHLDQAAAADPLYLSPYFDLDDLYCIGVASTGELMQSAVTSPAALLYHGHAAIIFTAAEDLVPGALLVDHDDNLSGLVVASYGEGKGRYVAYTNEGLYFAMLNLQESDDAPAADEDAVGWLSGVTLDWADGLLTVSWADAIANGEADETSCFLVMMKDTENDYYSYAITDPGLTSRSFPAIPGRTYAACVRTVEENDTSDRYFSHTHCVLSDPIPVEPFTLYDYKDEAIGVSVVPAGTVLDDMAELPIPETLTADMLDGSMDAYLYVVSRYSVSEMIERPMLIALTTPDNACMLYVGGYIFAPEYMAHDVWHMSLNDLFADYLAYGASGTLIPGTYTVSYYFDGLLVNTLSFSLE